MQGDRSRWRPDIQYVGTFEVGVGKIDKKFVKAGIKSMKACVFSGEAVDSS
jgi:hypothetical protein